MREYMHHGLFDTFGPQYNPGPGKRILTWIKENRFSFSLAAAASLGLHALLFCFTILSSFGRPADLSQENMRAFSKAFYNMKEQNPDVQLEVPVSVSGKEKGDMPDLPEVELGGDRISERDLAGLYKDLITDTVKKKIPSGSKAGKIRIKREDVLNQLQGKQSWGLESGGRAYPVPSIAGQSGARINVLGKDGLEELEELKRLQSMRRDYRIIEGRQVRVDTPNGIKFVPAGYFFRDCPYEQLAAAGADLFYIISGFPYVGGSDGTGPGHESGPGGQGFGSHQPKSRAKHGDGNFQVHLLNLPPDHVTPASLPVSSPASTAFSMPDSHEAKRILDELMVLPESRQLEVFRHEYLEQHNLDGRDLILLTERLFRENLTNVIIVVSEISGAFNYLEEVYYNKPLDKQVYDFWRDHPNSRAGVQFLLYLASYYDFERRALQNLFQAQHAAGEYLDERFTRSEIHQKKAKCFVIVRVYESFMRKLKGLGYENVTDVLRRYVVEQEKIYHRIIGMGGDFRDTGLYALGCLYWEGGRYDLALESWKQINLELRSNQALQDIRSSLSSDHSREELIRSIDSILEYYAFRDSKELLARQVRFGTWKKRIEISH